MKKINYKEYNILSKKEEVINGRNSIVIELKVRGGSQFVEVKKSDNEKIGISYCFNARRGSKFCKSGVAQSTRNLSMIKFISTTMKDEINNL